MTTRNATFQMTEDEFLFFAGYWFVRSFTQDDEFHRLRCEANLQMMQSLMTDQEKKEFAKNMDTLLSMTAEEKNNLLQQMGHQQ